MLQPAVPGAHDALVLADQPTPPERLDDLLVGDPASVEEPHLAGEGGVVLVEVVELESELGARLAECDDEDPAAAGNLF